MIFVTAGTQAPFDRLIKMIDELAEELQERVVAQTISCEYRAKNIEVISGLIDPTEFDAVFNSASVVISHAGMGSIISALVRGKPIVVVPRLAFCGEHRDDHQMVTAMRMNELGYVHVAYDKMQLRDLLVSSKRLSNLKSIGGMASTTLTNDLVDFIDNHERSK